MVPDHGSDDRGVLVGTRLTPLETADEVVLSSVDHGLNITARGKHRI